MSQTVSSVPDDRTVITRRVMVALRRIIRTVDLHSRALARGHGLTGPQLLVLKVIGERARPTMGEIAEAVHLSQATITGVLDRLERKGLVQRTRDDPDRRKIRVVATPAAEAVLAKAPPLLQESFAVGFASLQEWEKAQILSSLERLVVLMEAGELAAEPLLMGEALDGHHEGDERRVKGEA
jgi:DNA-binding MarR family transcriptional regulator